MVGYRQVLTQKRQHVLLSICMAKRLKFEIFWLLMYRLDLFDIFTTRFLSCSINFLSEQKDNRKDGLFQLWKLTNKTRWRKFPVIFYQINRNKISLKLVSKLIRNAFDFIMKLRGLAFIGMKFLYQEMKLFWKYRLSNGFISVIPQ